MSTRGGALSAALEEAARAPVLLVASDYDGTLAPIVEDPRLALPERESLVALRGLAQLGSTHAAVVSGRALESLHAVSGLPPEVHAVGSHGGEFDVGFAHSLSDGQRRLRERIGSELAAIAAAEDGLQLEEKPASVALHYRRADEAAARRALERVAAGPGALDGVTTRHGKQVVELLVLATSKGDALRTLRARLGASAVVFFGDDLTDETAFEVLRGPDVSVKVGPGETAARHRLRDTREVARALAVLFELRQEWLRGGSAVPIEEHAMLSDQRTIALVTPAARITWLCLPRIDSPGFFAELLGGPSAGYWAVRAADGSPPLEQRYRERSMVLETRFATFTVTDFLDCSLGRPARRAGRSDLLRVIEGTGEALVEFAPRIDFGRVPTRLRAVPEGLVVLGTSQPSVLRSPGVRWEIRQDGHDTGLARIALDGGRAVLDLRYGTRDVGDTRLGGPERRAATDEHWSRWASALVLPALEPELALRSALVLKALCHAPTGAIAAAGTTSLPEELGGSRNWDYRFCWPRDAALSAAALVRLGSTSEAMALADWVLGVLDTCHTPGAMQPLYGVAGETVPSEAEIGELAGYRGSRPVRVGNTAARQLQLDVFGPIAQLVHLLLEAEAPLSGEHWRLVEALVSAVAERWQEPDHGIWEERMRPRHHVHSKVMCWQTVDRAIKSARWFLEKERADWLALREAIASDVLAHGWKPRLGAFTAAYDSDEPDAAVLEVGLSGLLAPDDPRFVATVERVEERLREGPTVYRYRFDDALPGAEGGFHLCTAWLVRALHAIGRRDDARALFDDMVALAGPTGMLSEQYDPRGDRAVGNVPQCYSHLGLIECAVLLA